MAQTDSPDDDVRFVGGLAYAAPLGFRPLLLDLYLPAAGPDPAPLVVFMHGGGWLRGNRSMVGPRFASWQPGPLTRLRLRLDQPGHDRAPGDVHHPGRPVALAPAWRAFRCQPWVSSTGRASAGRRVNSAVQLASQVAPPSGEKACSQRAESAVMCDQVKRTRIARPSSTSSA
jgi:hypothetical protein